MFIDSYYNKNFEPFLGSLPDFYAVASSVKPLSRLTVSQENIKKTQLILDKFGIYFRKKQIRDKFYLYISKNKGILNQYPKKDPELKNKLSRIESEKFAEDLGYPSCCIKEYIKKNAESAKDYYYNFFYFGRYSFLLNNFLAGGSNYYLSFHKPCSMKCKSSINYNKSILNSIKKYDRDFYNKLIYYLKTEQIIVFDTQNNINDAWDNRFSIIKNKSRKIGLLMSKPIYSRIKFEKKFYNLVDFSHNVRVKEANKIELNLKSSKEIFSLNKNLISFNLKFS